jgi:small GTP-binding protein
MVESGLPARRVVVVGDTLVGKSLLISAAVEEEFNLYEPNTVGANWHLYSTVVSGQRFELQIWDTAGQERYRTLGPLYYRNAMAAIAVYDISSRESFQNLSRWTDSVVAVAGPDTLIFVVGNKADLADDNSQRKVTFDEGQEWATSQGRNYPFFETSAKTGQGVANVFQRLAETLAKHSRHQASVEQLVLRSDRCC